MRSAQMTRPRKQPRYQVLSWFRRHATILSALGISMAALGLFCGRRTGGGVRVFSFDAL